MKPKIKVLMPKWESLKGISWAKELLLSFVGTTLSIILTFGTAHFVDEKQKREAGRQSAMMVIHDMENSAELFRSYARDDEKDFNLACDVLGRLDQLESISPDTLYALAQFITAPSITLYNYDDSSEQIFLSSPEAWKNIDNPAFIDAVQSFYRARRTAYEALNSDKSAIRPVSHEEYYNAIVADADNNGHVGPTFITDFLRKRIGRKEVQYYIHQYPNRRAYYSRYSLEFTRMANKCKFIMGISDEELAQYVEQQEHNGKKLKDKILVGNWQVQGEADTYNEYHFNRDHTLLYINKQFIPNAAYTGSVEFDFLMPGTWEIQADSLILFLQPACELTTDTTHIRYQAEQKEYVDQLIRSWQQILESGLEHHKQEGGKREAFYGTIDATRNKIELTLEQTEDDEQPKVFYIFRLPN